MSNPCIFYLVLLLICCCSSHLLTSHSKQCNKQDEATLLRVKSSLGNPSILSTWVPATNCCGWVNVFCHDNGRVESLYLQQDATISAALPPAIGDLPELNNLYFSDVPGLYGPIPPSFAKLTGLTFLQISNASISGAIPSFISTFRNLTYLDLSVNKLTGAVPAWLNSIPKLDYVNLRQNQLTGGIPPGLTYGPLMTIDLAYNQLTGEIPRNYSYLAKIDFSHNKLTGDASYVFGADKGTVILDLSWNQFDFDVTGAVFPRSLTWLDLSHNKIRGSLSESFRGLNGLNHLDLTYNQLCGRIPGGRAAIMRTPAPYLHNKCLCGTPLSECHKKLLI